MRYLVTGRQKSDNVVVAKRFKGEMSARKFGSGLIQLEIYDTFKRETVVADNSKKSNEDFIR